MNVRHPLRWCLKAFRPFSKNDLHKLLETQQANISRRATRPCSTAVSFGPTTVRTASTLVRNTQEPNLEVPTGGLQEEPGPLLLHAGNGNELPHRLLLTRHFELALSTSPSVSSGRHKQQVDGSYPVSIPKNGEEKHLTVKQQNTFSYIKLRNHNLTHFTGNIL